MVTAHAATTAHDRGTAMGSTGKKSKGRLTEAAGRPIYDIATAAGRHSSQPSQPPRLDPPRLNRLSSDEQPELYRESNNDLNAVVDRLIQRTVENVPNAAPVDLAALKTAASTISQ